MMPHLGEIIDVQLNIHLTQTELRKDRSKRIFDRKQQALCISTVIGAIDRGSTNASSSSNSKRLDPFPRDAKIQLIATFGLVLEPCGTRNTPVTSLTRP